MSSSEQEKFTVVLEDLRDDFKMVIEKVDGLETKVGGLETKVDGLTDRIGSLETSVTTLTSEVVGLKHAVEEKVSKKEFNALEIKFTDLYQRVIKLEKTKA